MISGTVCVGAGLGVISPSPGAPKSNQSTAAGSTTELASLQPTFTAAYTFDFDELEEVMSPVILPTYCAQLVTLTGPTPVTPTQPTTP